MGGQDILNFLITYSPMLFVFMSLYIFIKLREINLKYHLWQITSLQIIPLSFFTLYIWIGFDNPPIEIARVGLRICVGIMLSIACSVLYTLTGGNGDAT